MRARVNGTELFFDVEGSQLVPDGTQMREQPIAFVLHGGPGMDHSYFRPWFTPLAERMQLIYVDHRGQGRSARMPNEEYTMENMADDLEQLRLLLGIDRPVVIGNSFGGMLALVYATRHPNRAGKLVLISTTPSHEFLNEATAIMEERGTEEQKQTMPTIFAGQVRTQEEYRQWWDVMLPMYFHAYDLEMGDRMLGRTIGNPEIARYMFEQGIPQYDVRPGLSAITVPTLILAGGHDWITPPSQNEEIHRLIPGSELHIFEHSGHMPFIEEQEEFLQVMRRFLGLEVPEMAGVLT